MSTFFLIHGASHGAWCWDQVIEELRLYGHRGVATDQPGLGSDTTPQDEVTWESTVAKLEADLEAIEGEVILVGHSMGGTLVAQLAENHPDKVKAAVYLAATLPRDGESCLSNALEDSSGARIFFAFEEMGLTAEDSFKLFPLLLFQDCPPDKAADAMGKLGPQPMTVFDGKASISEAREGSVPRYYIETLRDLVITAGQQRAMYTRRPVKKVFTLQTGHTAMYAAPAQVAEYLDEIATAEARDE